MNWDIVADSYHSLVGDKGDFHHQTFLNPVVFKFLGQIKGKKIVDLACGQGYFSCLLAKKGAIVTGIDMSKKLINLAKDNASKRDTVKYFVSDSAKMKQISNSSQDIIVSNMALHDIKNINGTIAECQRILKKTGTLIFSIPHPLRNLGTKGRDKIGYFWKMRHYGVNRIVPNKLYAEQGIVAYHRSLDYYLNLLIAHGFIVVGFREIYTTTNQPNRMKDQKYLEFKQEIPSFVIIKGVRNK